LRKKEKEELAEEFNDDNSEGYEEESI